MVIALMVVRRSKVWRPWQAVSRPANASEISRDIEWNSATSPVILRPSFTDQFGDPLSAGNLVESGAALVGDDDIAGEERVIGAEQGQKHRVVTGYQKDLDLRETWCMCGP